MSLICGPTLTDLSGVALRDRSQSVPARPHSFQKTLEFCWRRSEGLSQKIIENWLPPSQIQSSKLLAKSKVGTTPLSLQPLVYPTWPDLWLSKRVSQGASQPSCRRSTPTRGENHRPIPSISVRSTGEGSGCQNMSAFSTVFPQWIPQSHHFCRLRFSSLCTVLLKEFHGKVPKHL
jgi:hypothetical protein